MADSLGPEINCLNMHVMEKVQLAAALLQVAEQVAQAWWLRTAQRGEPREGQDPVADVKHPPLPLQDLDHLLLRSWADALRHVRNVGLSGSSEEARQRSCPNLPSARLNCASLRRAAWSTLGTSWNTLQYSIHFLLTT